MQEIQNACLFRKKKRIQVELWLLKNIFSRSVQSETTSSHRLGAAQSPDLFLLPVVLFACHFSSLLSILRAVCIPVIGRAVFFSEAFRNMFSCPVFSSEHVAEGQAHTDLCSLLHVRSFFPSRTSLQDHFSFSILR